ncbi:hypothetical protein RFI_15957 [Reticulomyxa filosa]|uniref:Transmembrane protein n=1 Tax=Reticulomyxa filosa TaxID=46433 RepID=X6N5N9_RETFI|nr:hypothetical protein RFI_15957 [Reticulomyxa filosa]|eukprot:ETO21248.1 hypothetical protein RFI_15957 [Reticulomyxa filosa]
MCRNNKYKKKRFRDFFNKTQYLTSQTKSYKVFKLSKELYWFDNFASKPNNFNKAFQPKRRENKNITQHTQYLWAKENKPTVFFFDLDYLIIIGSTLLPQIIFFLICSNYVCDLLLTIQTTQIGLVSLIFVVCCSIFFCISSTRRVRQRMRIISVSARTFVFVTIYQRNIINNFFLNSKKE